MISYEITTQVSDSLIEDYETYMIGQHIPEVLATGCFIEASISLGDPGNYRIRYLAHDRPTFNRYIAQHAEGLREHFNGRFPEGVTLSRSVWETIKEWPAG